MKPTLKQLSDEEQFEAQITDLVKGNRPNFARAYAALVQLQAGIERANHEHQRRMRLINRVSKACERTVIICAILYALATIISFLMRL